MTGVEIALIAGTTLAAVGSLSAAAAAKSNAEFNARMHELNARLAKEAAAGEEDDFRREARRAQGTQLVALGAAGVETTAGTPLDLQGLAASEAELTARRIRHAGEVDAARETASAGAERFQGAAEFRAGLFKAGSTLLTGAADVAQYRNSQAALKKKAA